MVHVTEVMSWKEDLAQKGREKFGPKGAHANTKTYEFIRSQCVPGPAPNPLFSHIAAIPFNTLHIHVVESVPDDMLEPCDCTEYV